MALGVNLLILAYFKHDTVEIDDGVNGIQRARLPLGYLINNGIRHC